MRVAILGTGLIGGSVGLALRALDGRYDVVVYDVNASSAQRAVERGAAHAAAASPAEAVAGARLVFVATPVGAILDVVASIAPALEPGAVVTDVGSTKSTIVRPAEELLSATGATFIGGHPMAGTEEEGIDGANGALFHGAWWIVTPTGSADPGSYRLLHGVLTEIGARVMALDADQHDELVAIVSHLPHLTAASLMNMALERSRDHAGLLALAAGGFRDVTRVAASAPEIWLDICRENRDAIVAILDAFARRLDTLRELIARGDREALDAFLREARDGRRNLPGQKTTGELFHVVVPVPDRPGVLAEVTTLVGNLGVNIEDLDLSHAEEGGRGALRLTILGADEARTVADALRARGYEPRSTPI